MLLRQNPSHFRISHLLKHHLFVGVQAYPAFIQYLRSQFGLINGQICSDANYIFSAYRNSNGPKLISYKLVIIFGVDLSLWELCAISYS